VKRFTALYRSLDATTSTQKKVALLAAYFRSVAPHDAAWAAYFLAGGKPRQAVPTSVLRQMACEMAGIDAWLFEESHAVTGDLAEAIAYVLPPPKAESQRGLAAWVEGVILPLRDLQPEAQRERVAQAWSELQADERFIFVKLVGGGFRVGVSRLLVARALGEVAGLDAKVIAQRMMGFTDGKLRPTAERFAALIGPLHADGGDAGQPYPFFLAHPLAAPAASLGRVDDWMVEWKYDGIRAQIVARQGGIWVWSRGEELVTERFPEVEALARRLPPGTVLDGEILAWRAGDAQPLPFAVLQRRIGRKTVTRKVLADSPVTFLAYDLIEHAGGDMRGWSQRRRREVLEAVAAASGIALSPVVRAAGWDELRCLHAESRARGVEGFMLKHVDSRYGVGRTKADGTWWKWKIDPIAIDCVLVYAQAGHGRRASLYTDYTFAVWNRKPASAAEATAVLDAIASRLPAREGDLQLVAFAKAYSGLTDDEFRQVDKVVRKTTVEKFGPVRSVRPSLVFELGFEAINRSTRHKSGIATRFPRMLRLRPDKPVWEADTLETLLAMVA
jgi:DNA ligase-1